MKWRQCNPERRASTRPDPTTNKIPKTRAPRERRATVSRSRKAVPTPAPQEGHKSLASQPCTVTDLARKQSCEPRHRTVAALHRPTPQLHSRLVCSSTPSRTSHHRGSQHPSSCTHPSLRVEKPLRIFTERHCRELRTATSDMLHHEERSGPDEKIELNGTLGTAECLVVERFPRASAHMAWWHHWTTPH